MIWGRSPDVLWRVAPQYLALAGIDGRSIAVHGPGADVWDVLATPASTAAIVDAVAHRYAVEPSVVAGDIDVLLQDLRARGYVVADS